jgi:hypothetical protein
LIPAIIYTHIAVGKLVPGISDLPTNLDKGFDMIFGFSSLTADAKKIANAAKAALANCDTSYGWTHTTNGRRPIGTPAKAVAQPGCATLQGKPAFALDLPTYDIANEEKNVDAAFTSSLATIRKVANDKYLGVQQFNDTATQLNSLEKSRKDMKEQLKKGSNSTANSSGSSARNLSCLVIVPMFCNMDAQAVLLENGVAKVNAQIQKLTNSDAVKMFEDNKGWVQALHGMPYVLVLAFVAFSFFWWKGGVCCCCREGTRWGCIAIPVFALLWLVALFMWGMIGGIGFFIKTNSKNIKVDVLKGKPSLWEVTKHFETMYPVFWNTVFKELYDGCVILLPCAYLFIVVCILIGLYACCECCCCPYRETQKKQGADGVAVNTADDRA